MRGVSSINRRSFLAELRSLLSFMDPADRQLVLRKYESMFDEAGPDGEEALIARFGSPVRQVLRIERQYRESLRRREEAMSAPDAQEAPSVSEMDLEPEAEEGGEDAEEEIDLFAPEEPEAVPEVPEESEAEAEPEEGTYEPKPEVIENNETESEPESGSAPGILPVPAEASAEPEAEGTEEIEAPPEEIPAEPEVPEAPEEPTAPEDIAVARWLAAVENGLDAGIVPETPTDEEAPAPDAEDETEEESVAVPYAARGIDEETFAKDTAEPSTPTQKTEKSKPSGGRVFGAILVTIPMIAFVALGVVLSVVLALAFMALGAFFGVACIYLGGYVFGGKIGFMPDLLLTGGAAVACLAFAALLMWTGIWLGVGGCMLTVRITAAVYRSILQKGGASHG